MNSTIIEKYNAIPRRRYRNEETGKESIWLKEVLGRDVVVNKTDLCIHRDPGPFRETCFEGIVVIPPAKVITEETQRIFDIKKTRQLRNIGMLVELFEEVVEREWEPEKFHFVLHSSGYDSRMLSEAIRRIWKRRGDAWLGKVLFVCNKFEGDEFKKIMEYQGWDKDQFMVVGENTHIEQYHAPSLDFETAWKRLNCIFGLPVNLFYYPIEAAQVAGIAPADEEVQSWCNYLIPIDYTLKLDLWDRYRFLYFHGMGGRNFKGENMEFPGAHPYLLSVAYQYETELPLNAIKREMVREMDRKLFELQETSVNLQGDWGRPISNRLYRTAVAKYEQSWYGRQVMEVPEQTVNFSRWWRRWSIASFCQHLIKDGYRLRMI